MFKLTSSLVLSLFFIAILANLSFGEETGVQHGHKTKHFKKHEYHLKRHVEHPDVDAETIAKHGASMEDAIMQADGLRSEKKRKSQEESVHDETKLQEAGGEKKQRPHHFRHGPKSEKAEESKEERIAKRPMHSDKHSKHEGVILKEKKEEVENGSQHDAKAHERTHDKKKKGRKHAFGHKKRKHGGKKPKLHEKPEKKDKKMIHKN